MSADMTGRDLNEMFRIGRLSLAIGIAVLAADRDSAL